MRHGSPTRKRPLGRLRTLLVLALAGLSGLAPSLAALPGARGCAVAGDASCCCPPAARPAPPSCCPVEEEAEGTPSGPRLDLPAGRAGAPAELCACRTQSPVPAGPVRPHERESDSAAGLKELVARFVLVSRATPLDARWTSGASPPEATELAPPVTGTWPARALETGDRLAFLASARL